MEEIYDKRLEVYRIMDEEERILLIQMGDPELREIVSILRRPKTDRTKLENDQVKGYKLINGRLKRDIRVNEILSPRDDLTDWPQIKNAIIEHFSDARDLAELTVEFNNIKNNKSENLVEYRHRIRTSLGKLIAKLNLSQLTNKPIRQEILIANALDRFLVTIPYQIAMQIRSRKPNTLEQAITYAQDELNFVQRSNQSHVNLFNTHSKIFSKQPQTNPVSKNISNYKNFNQPPQPQINPFLTNASNHRFSNQTYRPQFQQNQFQFKQFYKPPSNVFKPNQNINLPKPTPVSGISSIKNYFYEINPESVIFNEETNQYYASVNLEQFDQINPEPITNDEIINEYDETEPESIMARKKLSEAELVAALEEILIEKGENPIDSDEYSDHVSKASDIASEVSVEVLSEDEDLSEGDQDSSPLPSTSARADRGNTPDPPNKTQPGPSGLQQTPPNLPTNGAQGSALDEHTSELITNEVAIYPQPSSFTKTPESIRPLPKDPPRKKQTLERNESESDFDNILIITSSKELTDIEDQMRNEMEKDNFVKCVINVNDYVLVRFTTDKTIIKHFVRRVLEMVENNEYFVNFMRRRKPAYHFVYPDVPDQSIVSLENMIKLPPPSYVGGTARASRKLTFSVKFENSLIMSSYVPCAVPGCDDRKSSRDRFPNPEKNNSRFDTWITLIANPKLVNLQPLEVYRNYRVCHQHFTMDDKSSIMYLKRTAVQSLKLPIYAAVLSEMQPNIIGIPSTSTFESDIRKHDILSKHDQLPSKINVASTSVQSFSPSFASESEEVIHTQIVEDQYQKNTFVLTQTPPRSDKPLFKKIDTELLTIPAETSPTKNQVEEEVVPKEVPTDNTTSEQKLDKVVQEKDEEREEGVLSDGEDLFSNSSDEYIPSNNEASTDESNIVSDSQLPKRRHQFTDIDRVSSQKGSRITNLANDSSVTTSTSKSPEIHNDEVTTKIDIVINNDTIKDLFCFPREENGKPGKGATSNVSPKLPSVEEIISTLQRAQIDAIHDSGVLGLYPEECESDTGSMIVVGMPNVKTDNYLFEDIAEDLVFVEANRSVKEDLKSINEQLYNNTDIFYQLVCHLRRNMANNEKDCIYKILHSCFSLDLARRCSLMGKHNNIKLDGIAIINAIKDAALQNYPNLPNEKFKSALMDWFRGAELRHKRYLQKQ
ncbi:hypothetical protein RN001_009082 [Aquatica leii]|uniref:THAP-type domain-containing protein n=1 Tax=Aquatica leii TaxID=1421715 RepID=A0AAN7P857_9COLE|nr:hypothetical protein RN001_009082 [Aquatica leii]